MLSIRFDLVALVVIVSISTTTLRAEDKAPPLVVAPFDATKAKQHQEAWAKHLKMDAEVTNSVGMKFRLIPAGEFVMGSAESEVGRDNDEIQHRVRITKPFYLGNYEVTQAEYRRVTKYNPSWFSATGKGSQRVKGLQVDRLPVEAISWYEALLFCNQLSQLEKLPSCYFLEHFEHYADGSLKKADVTMTDGDGYRLPTEAEWEFACRAGTTTTYHFGAESNGLEANVDGRDAKGATKTGIFLGRTTTVGSYGANPFGLYDMHGNVWEWCSDWYDTNYYTNSPTNNPRGTETGSLRIRRGGSWDRELTGSRSAYRRQSPPSHRFIFIGFRVARSPSGQSPERN